MMLASNIRVALACALVAGVGVLLILAMRSIRSRRRREFGRQTLELLRMAAVRGASVMPVLRRTAAAETRAKELEWLTAIIAELDNGRSLADALHRGAPACFAVTTIAALRAAESSDRLKVALTDAVREHDAGSAIAFRLRLAVGYPAMVGALLLLLSQSGLSGRAFDSVDGGAPALVAWLAGFCVAIWLAVEIGLDSRRIRTKLAGAPVIGHWLRSAATTRVMRSMSTLVTAGASLDTAIRDSAHTAGHAELERDLLLAADAAADGAPPAEVWKRARLPQRVARDLSMASSPSNFAQRLRGVAERGMQQMSDAAARGQRNFQIVALALLGGGIAMEFSRLLNSLNDARLLASEGMPW